MAHRGAQQPSSAARSRIVIPGGSGQVGTILAEAFHRAGHDVVVLSRTPHVRPWRVVAWDGVHLDALRRAAADLCRQWKARRMDTTVGL